MDDVLTELRLANESIDRGNAAQRHKQEATDRAIDALWKDLAALRDELHAVANRIEANTRTPFTEATHDNA